MFNGWAQMWQMNGWKTTRDTDVCHQEVIKQALRLMAQHGHIRVVQPNDGDPLMLRAGTLAEMALVGLLQV